MYSGANSGVSASRLRDSLLITLQGDLNADTLRVLCTDVLQKIQAENIKTAIFDVSAIEVMDLKDFDDLHGVLRMVKLLGTQPLVVGLNPGVVAFLVSSGADTSDVLTARGLEDVDRVLAAHRAHP